MNCWRSVYRLDTRSLKDSTGQIPRGIGRGEAPTRHVESFCDIGCCLHAGPSGGGSARAGGRSAASTGGPCAVDAGPPPDTGVVASGPPGIAHTPDGRTLTVVAKDETQLPVAPLTTSLSSRDWLVGATFTGSGMASAKGGSMEVGYQIGCGIEMDKIKLNGSIGIGTGAFELQAHAAVPAVPVRSPSRSRARSRSSPGPARSPTSRWTRSRSRATRRASRSRTSTSRSTTASARRRCGPMRS